MMNPYDALPYQCQFRAQMHPAHLASIGVLRGLSVPSLSTMRMLELGCADGTHSISLALAFPDATFVGVDSSERQIQSGHTHVQNLGLKNIELHQHDIMTIDDSWGKFDFVVAHGVYSWTPPEVQTKILTICRENLADNGIAYVSYNTRPGWNMRGIIRDMLMYHTQQFEDTETKLSQLHAWLEFAYEYVKDRNTPYDHYLKEELEIFRNAPDYYLFHEMLEECNEPIYFHEFMASAEKHKLQYMGDSLLPLMFREFNSEQVDEINVTLGTDLPVVYREQYLDFLDNSYFRHTLLCHEDVVLAKAALTPESVRDFHFSSSLAPNEETLDLTTDSSENFENDFAVISENMPISKAALKYLHQQWPQSVSFDTLYEHAAEMVQEGGGVPEGDDRWLNRNHLMSTMESCYVKGIIDASIQPIRFMLSIGERPTADPAIRFQAEQGNSVVVNLRNEPVTLNPILANFLPYLDGQRDQQALLAILQAWVEEGKIQPPPGKDGKPLTPTPNMVHGLLQNTLRRLATNALLIA